MKVYFLNPKDPVPKVAQIIPKGEYKISNVGDLSLVGLADEDIELEELEVTTKDEEVR